MHQAIIEYPTPLCITEELSEVSDQIENLRDYQTRLKITSNFAASLLAKAPGNPRAIWRHFSDDITLCVFIRVPGFTWEAAPALCQYLELISDCYDTPPLSTDNPGSGYRVYSFSPIDPTVNIGVDVFAELEENSENCQRIIVGIEKRKSFKLVEVDEPVYAFKC